MKAEFNNCSIIHSNIFIFLTTLHPRGISSKTFLVSRHGLFFAVENPQKVEDLHQAIFFFGVVVSVVYYLHLLENNHRVVT